MKNSAEREREGGGGVERAHVTASFILYKSTAPSFFTYVEKVKMYT